MRLFSAAVLAAVALLVCSGCGGSPPAGSAAASPAPETTAVCASSDVVVDCTTDGPVTIVTVSGAASDGDTIALARDLHAASADGADSSDAQTLLRRESTDPVSLDPEFATPAPWTVTIQPAALADVETAVLNALAIESIPGIVGIDAGGAWPEVTITTLDRFDEAFDAASALEVFDDGGTYRLLSLNEHLRIVHTPLWVAPALIHEVIAIAESYPTAEVLLEAQTGGGTPPTLYIARLSPAQVDELAARLSDARLSDAVAETVSIEYVLGSIGEEGTTYLSGIIGTPTA